MKPVEGRNDFIFFRTNGVVGIATHKLEAGFIRFCSRVGKKDSFGKGGVTELACQTNRRFIGIDVRDVPEFSSLLL